MKEPFYITTTLPYVNAPLHIGHALEFVRADTIARYKKASGRHVFFNTGTDEHGQKIAESAAQAEKTPKEYVDGYFPIFKETVLTFGVDQELIHFVRTTDPHHERAAQAFWRTVRDNGHIYKKNYQAKYCVGCEETKTDSEIVDERCPIHPNRELEVREEENYFFRFSAFGDRLLSLYESGAFRVIPDSRFNEMKEFIKRGLEDFSISRLKEKMPWGVPVPDDETHVMYVWFDALINYISTIGWPEDAHAFARFWKEGTPVQYCGKDNTRFQSVMWQAMLLAADLPSSHTVVVNGFITSGGQKMSKSIGNVIDPLEVIERFRTITPFASDVLRFVLLHDVSSFEDGDLTMESITRSYSAHLANGLGNLVSRTLKMVETYAGGASTPPAYEPPLRGVKETIAETTVIDLGTIAYVIERDIRPRYEEALESFELNRAAGVVWELIGILDRHIADYQPFKLVKTDPDAAKAVLWSVLVGIHHIADMLVPFLPETAKAIKKHLGATGDGPALSFVTTPLETPLFPRYEEAN